MLAACQQYRSRFDSSLTFDVVLIKSNNVYIPLCFAANKILEKMNEDHDERHFEVIGEQNFNRVSQQIEKV